MTPQPYLSYSQKNLWKNSKKAYMDRYAYGKKFTSREMAFGKIMADALEKDELTGDIELDSVMMRLPAYEIRDKIIEAVLKGKPEVPMVARPDSAKADYSAILEYKTGVEPWTQKKVDEDDQLTFYASFIYVLKGTIPHLKLVWVKTEKDEQSGRIRATGEIEEFETTRTLRHVLPELAEMRRVWKEINIAFEDEIL